MSDPYLQDPALRSRTTSLRHSGPLWQDRITPAQQPLVRQLSLLASDSETRVRLAAAGDWLQGRPAVGGALSWAFQAADVFTAAPGFWGYARYPLPSLTPPEALEGDRLLLEPMAAETPLLLEGGNVLVVPAGGLPPSGVPPTEGLLTLLGEEGATYLLGDDAEVLALTVEATFSSSLEVTLAAETAWFLRLPAHHAPLALETALGDLLPGSDFRCAAGWLLLREAPSLLWPDGIAHATATAWTPPCARHRALRSNRMKSSGKYVAAYKRRSQSPAALCRALAELAGIPVFERDATVLRVVETSGGLLHQLDDGSTFTLPGAGGYQTGSAVRAGSIAGNLIEVRHRSLQGEAWWAGRNTSGIDIGQLRPGFSGFAIRDEQVAAVCTSVGGRLRATLDFAQNPVAEARYWQWQHRQEDARGVETFARDVLGFTAPGYRMVNPLELWAGMLGPWLTLVESPLLTYDPGLWQELLDFIEREKPAGALVILQPV